MPLITLKRFDGTVLYEVAAETKAAACAHAAAVGIDLSGVDLSAVDLRRARLSGARLAGACLSFADLSRANLIGADLRAAYLCDAVLRRASFRGADLSGARLDGSDLYRAQLNSATVLTDATMPHGESWEEYLETVVPSLLTAGGKTLAEVLATGCWECHSWENCPMRVAFGVVGAHCAPPLLRPRVAEFVAYFDARLIPKPTLPADPSTPEEPGLG